ncbi:MAG: hypothetical protein HYW25_02580 [Candidatus Aenigmarchaeota archaeon]|nr:hypothetical protein [Candidatus Aenigmarchaeota archaeon]
MTVSKKDGEELIKLIERKIPPFAKSFLPAPPELLKKLPESSRKYTIQELIDFLEKAWKDGKIKW